MKNGSIVMSIKDNERLFRIKGIINGKKGRRIAILEELCKCSTKANFAYIDSLNLVWTPKILHDAIEEYDISDIEEELLMDSH